MNFTNRFPSLRAGSYPVLGASERTARDRYVNISRMHADFVLGKDA